MTPALAFRGANAPAAGVWGGSGRVQAGAGRGAARAAQGRQEPRAARARETHGLAPSFAANYTWHFQTLINSSLGTRFSSRSRDLGSNCWGGGVTPTFARVTPQPRPQGHSRDHLQWPPGSVASPAGRPSSQRGRLTGASHEQL